LDGRLGTAAAHATHEVPVARPDETVDAVLEGLRGRAFASAAVVAVCADGRLSGLVTIERLLAAPADAAVGDVMDTRPPLVAPGTDQEHAAWQAVQHGEPGLAVVDADGRLLGLIPPQRLLEVLLEEHDEDLARIGGYLRDTAAARSAAVEGGSPPPVAPSSVVGDRAGRRHAVRHPDGCVRDPAERQPRRRVLHTGHRLPR
jgi:magnesium transporter